jgi:pyruvate formate lyase activating enzyme
VTLNRAVPAHQAPTRRLASWRPTTLREWPGHVATSLRLWGCSFDCPECSSSSLRGPVDEAADWTHIVAHIDSNRSMLDGVVVTGGEPTEDPDLPSLLAALKELDVAVRLDTNGARPDVLAMLLAEALVDNVALDIKTVPARYRQVCSERDMAARIAECVDMLVSSDIEHEFRTTLIPGLVDPASLPSIARTLQGGRLYALQQFVPVSEGAPEPLPDEALSLAAAACRRFLPTIVRGIDIGED